MQNEVEVFILLLPMAISFEFPSLRDAGLKLVAFKTLFSGYLTFTNIT